MYRVPNDFMNNYLFFVSYRIFGLMELVWFCCRHCGAFRWEGRGQTPAGIPLWLWDRSSQGTGDPHSSESRRYTHSQNSNFLKNKYTRHFNGISFPTNGSRRCMHSLKNTQILVAWLPVHIVLRYVLLQNHWANFNQTWHEALMDEGDSSLLRWSPLYMVDN